MKLVTQKATTDEANKENGGLSMYCFGGHWASKFEASVAAPLVGPYYKGLIRLESGKPNTPSTKKINCMYIYIFGWRPYLK